jgi:hypothetical protein
LKVSSSAVTKTRNYDDTGSHEDWNRKGRPRVTSAAEDKFMRVNLSQCCLLLLGYLPNFSFFPPIP